jgi:hypothetical protein
VLTQEFLLAPHDIGRLIRVSAATIERVRADPAGVPAAERYALALRCSYLLHALADARPAPAA